MRGTTEFELDGSRYSCGQYSATKATKMLAKLAKLVGKPIGMLSAAGEGAEVTPDLLGAVIEAVTSQIEPDEFVALVKDILEGVHVVDENGNRPVVFDSDFSGRIGHMMKVVRKVLEFQFSDFFGDLTASIGGLAVKSKVQAR